MSQRLVRFVLETEEKRKVEDYGTQLFPAKSPKMRARFHCLEDKEARGCRRGGEREKRWAPVRAQSRDEKKNGKRGGWEEAGRKPRDGDTRRIVGEHSCSRGLWLRARREGGGSRNRNHRVVTEQPRNKREGRTWYRP